MAIPSSGPLSLDDIQTEFGGTNPISLSEYYAGGGLVQSGATGDSGPIPTSGQIAIGQFYGSTARVPIVINNTGTTLKASIYALASADPTYSAGITDVVYNNSGTLYSDARTSAALRTGTFASGDTVKIVNTGLIIGKGGNGGVGNPGGTGLGPTNNGGAGGRALALQWPVTIDNTGGTIAGGGGGGAGGIGSGYPKPNPNPKAPPSFVYYGGGGGGGGAGTNVGTGGTGGTPDGSPGSNGTPSAGGAGGASTGSHPAPIIANSTGGTGGNRGSAGSPAPGGTGGAAGQAIISNGNTITWIDMGTINGPTT